MTRLRPKAIVGVASLACALVLVPQSTGGPWTLPRSATDRPDDRPGAQIHALYVLPSDGSDRALDTDGTIDASVANFQGWLTGQTGGRQLHMDTFQGELDVSFHRLGQTDAQLAANGIFLRDAIERALKAAGFNVAGKIYAVYYDGSSTAACGGGAWPPALPGNVGAVYMRATFGPGLLCYDPSLSRSRLQIMDFAVLHEVLHTMGFVPTCAPHHTRAGHVSDRPDDLMWAGEGDWRPAVLDVGHDDYFDANVPGCPDFADSEYLEQAPQTLTVSIEAQDGNGTIVSEPTGISCPPTCSAEFGWGSAVTLTATPGPRSVFVRWVGDCTGRGTCTVTMEGARSVDAVFWPRRFRLSVITQGPGRVTSAPGGISCPRRCSAVFGAGLRVVLRAVPAKGARLAAWRGACRGRSRCAVSMSRDHSVRALFRR